VLKEMNNNKRRIDTVCFGGQDWWYHHRAHVDLQLMRRFARMGTTLYVNSIVMQKPSLKKNTGGGKSFTHKLVRKTKSIFTGLARVLLINWFAKQKASSPALRSQTQAFGCTVRLHCQCIIFRGFGP